MNHVDDVLGWLRVENPDCLIREVGIEKIEIGPTQAKPRSEIDVPEGWEIVEEGREIDGHPARYVVERAD